MIKSGGPNSPSRSSLYALGPNVGVTYKIRVQEGAGEIHMLGNSKAGNLPKRAQKTIGLPTLWPPGKASIVGRAIF